MGNFRNIRKPGTVSSLIESHLDRQKQGKQGSGTSA
jgi:hypothetical protein